MAARLEYIDNLRSTIIVLMVSMHAADTYSPLGNWYFTDRTPLSMPRLFFFAAWQMYLQSFFMGLLFFVAGYFVPDSLRRKGRRAYVRGRAFRLGLPVLLYMFAIGPMTEYFVSRSWTSSQPTSFAKEWWKHVLNGEFLQENGPLWFCLALLVFCLAYVALADSFKERCDATPPTNRALIYFALLMAAFEFAIRLIVPHATFLNMHLGDFSQYVLMFSAGAYAARGQWLQRLSHRAGLIWLSVVLPAGFIAWLLLLWKGGALSGHGESYSGGWHWESVCLDLWESFTCVAISYALLVIYREKMNSENRISRFLADNAFSVYVFHPPVVITIARLLQNTSIEPLSKFVLLTILSVVASFVLCALVLRRIPLLRTIL